ncbi:MAG TPA: polymer-forming cytoskeletal protein [Rudaea sp.]|jgi:cytoskeletal protein CcmA (bactofilin family)|nr:polymer-forming cytoskeletal protein [Rudaea sp.]
MFSSNRKPAIATADSTTLIASGTAIKGDIEFSGHLHVDGRIEGAIRGIDAQAMLTLSEHANVTGQVQAPHIVVNGAITGDVTASERLELASNARVEGNVYYKVLEMSAGAQINGKMVHRAEPPRQLPKPEDKTITT